MSKKKNPPHVATPEMMAGFLSKVETLIAINGWMALSIFANETVPEYSYSVGFEKWANHPEVIIFTLPPATGQSYLRKVGRDLKVGIRYDKPGLLKGFFGEYDGYLVKVRPAEVDEHMQIATGRSTLRVQAFQIVVADENNKFPWEDGARRVWQPVLGDIAPST